MSQPTRQGRGTAVASTTVYETEGGRTYLENLRQMKLSKETEEVLREVEAERDHSED